MLVCLRSILAVDTSFLFPLSSVELTLTIIFADSLPCVLSTSCNRERMHPINGCAQQPGARARRDGRVQAPHGPAQAEGRRWLPPALGRTRLHEAPAHLQNRSRDRKRKPGEAGRHSAQSEWPGRPRPMRQALRGQPSWRAHRCDCPRGVPPAAGRGGPQRQHPRRERHREVLRAPPRFHLLQWGNSGGLHRQRGLDGKESRQEGRGECVRACVRACACFCDRPMGRAVI